MKKLFSLILILLVGVATGQQTVTSDKIVLLQSGNQANYSNAIKGSSVSVGFTIAGNPTGPTFFTAIVSGCAAQACTPLQGGTYTGSGNATTTISPTVPVNTIYDYFSTVVTWQGGTQVAAVVTYTISSGSASPGQATPAVLAYTSTIPTGTCTAYSEIQLVTPSGQLYTCQNGTWTILVTPGGLVIPNPGAPTVGNLSTAITVSTAFGFDSSQFTSHSSTDLGKMIQDAFANSLATIVGPYVYISPPSTGTTWAMNSDPFSGFSRNGGLVRQLSGTITTDVTIALPNKTSWKGQLKGDSGANGSNSAILASATWRANYPAVFSANNTDLICLSNNSNAIVAGTNVGGVCTAGANTPFTSNLAGYVLYIGLSSLSNPSALTRANMVPVGIVQTFTDNQHISLYRNIANPVTIPALNDGYQYAFIKPLSIIGLPTTIGACPTQSTCIGNQQQFEDVTFNCGDTGAGGTAQHLGGVNLHGQENVWYQRVGFQNCDWGNVDVATTGAQDSGPYSFIIGQGNTTTTIPVGIWQTGYFHGFTGNSTINTRLTQPTNILYVNTINKGAVEFNGIHIESGVDGITCGDLLTWPWVTGGTGCQNSRFIHLSTASTVTNALHIVNATGAASSNLIAEGFGGTATHAIQDDVHSDTLSFAQMGPAWYFSSPVFEDGIKIGLGSSTALTSVSGTSSKLATLNGSTTNNDYAGFDANGNVVDIGGAVAPSSAYYQTGGTSISIGAPATNATKLWGFITPVNTTGVTTINWSIATADNNSGAGHNYGIAILDSTGALIKSTGALPGTTFSPSTGTKSATWSGGGTMTLTAGAKYYIAWTTDCASACAALGGNTQGSFQVGGAGATTSGGVPAGGTPPSDSYNMGNFPGIILHQ